MPRLDKLPAPIPVPRCGTWRTDAAGIQDITWRGTPLRDFSVWSTPHALRDFALSVVNDPREPDDFAAAAAYLRRRRDGH